MYPRVESSVVGSIISESTTDHEHPLSEAHAPSANSPDINGNEGKDPIKIDPEPVEQSPSPGKPLKPFKNWNIDNGAEIPFVIQVMSENDND